MPGWESEEMLFWRHFAGVWRAEGKLRGVQEEAGGPREEGTQGPGTVQTRETRGREGGRGRAWWASHVWAPWKQKRGETVGRGFLRKEPTLGRAKWLFSLQNQMACRWEPGQWHLKGCEPYLFIRMFWCLGTYSLDPREPDFPKTSWFLETVEDFPVGAYFTCKPHDAESSPKLIRLSCILCAQSLRGVWVFVTLGTIACQAPLSMGFSRQEYWSG